MDKTTYQALTDLIDIVISKRDNDVVNKRNLLHFGMIKIKQEAESLVTEFLRQHGGEMHWEDDNNDAPMIMGYVEGIENVVDFRVSKIYIDDNGALIIKGGVCSEFKFPRTDEEIEYLVEDSILNILENLE